MRFCAVLSTEWLSEKERAKTSTPPHTALHWIALCKKSTFPSPTRTQFIVLIHMAHLDREWRREDSSASSTFLLFRTRPPLNSFQIAILCRHAKTKRGGGREREANYKIIIFCFLPVKWSSPLNEANWLDPTVVHAGNLSWMWNIATNIELQSYQLWNGCH